MACSSKQEPGRPDEGARFAGASLSLRVFGLVGDSIVDGPGLRFSVFCQGCPHACPGCHNPGSWPFGGGSILQVGQVLDAIHKNPLCRAVTLSGGEPFSQAEALCALAAQLKAEGYEVAAYSGYTFEELLAGTPEQRQLLTHLDTLIDGRFEQDKLNLGLRFRGSSNQRILNVPHSLAARAPVWETAPRWVGDAGG